MTIALAASEIADLLATERAREIASRLLEVHRQAGDMRSWTEYREFIDSRQPGDWSPFWMGATYDRLGVAGHELAQWVTRGLLFFGYRSRKISEYRLVDPPATEAALLAFTEPVPELADEPAQIPGDLFDIVYGLEDVKRQLRHCLEADAPVHALLVGSPGSAKSMLLDEVARCGKSHYALAGNTTKAGLTEYLLGPNPCRYLLMDELEKGVPVEMDALLSLMESGLVTQTKFGRTDTKHVYCWVFAAANSTKGVRVPLLDRFNVIHVPDLDRDGFVNTAENVLARRVGLDTELAREIAALCADRTRQIRRARDIGRMCKGDRKLARELIESFLPSS